MILKPLTATVTLNNDHSASIVVTNDQSVVILGPLTHHRLDTKPDPAAPLNDHIQQLKSRMNITKVVSNMPGIKTTKER